MGKKNKGLGKKQPKPLASEKRYPVIEGEKEKREKKREKNEEKKRKSREFELSKMSSYENSEAKRLFSKAPLAIEVQSGKQDSQGSLDGQHTRHISADQGNKARRGSIYNKNNSWYGNHRSLAEGGHGGSYSGGAREWSGWGNGGNNWNGGQGYEQYSESGYEYYGYQQDQQNWYGGQNMGGFGNNTGAGCQNFSGYSGWNYRANHGPDRRNINIEAINQLGKNVYEKVSKSAINVNKPVLKKTKRAKQSIEEIKKQHSKKKTERAQELAKDLEEKSEIADKAAKIKEVLGSLPSSVMFSPQHYSHDYQQPQTPEPETALQVPPRVKIDKLMVPDLVLSASDFAEVGTGKSFPDTDEENITDLNEGSLASSRPTILPVLLDDQVVPPPSSTTGKSYTPRVAYTPGLVEGMQARKRTVSESSCLPESPQKRSKRGRISSEVASAGVQCIDEAMGQIMDKKRVEKLKKSLLKMNKKSLRELVNNPTSSKSRLLMSALVQENKSLISNCLNRSRFVRFEEAGESRAQADALEHELDALPSNVMMEISDIIKQEVPDIEVILEVKQEQDLECGPIDLNVKCEVEYGQEEEDGAVDLVEVPVPPKTPPPCIDLDIEASEEASTSKSSSLSGVSGSSDPLDSTTRLAPVYKRRGRGQARRIGGHEVVIGTVSDLVNVQGYDSNETNNGDHVEIDLDIETSPVVEDAEQDNSNKMKSLKLIFEQESRLLSDLESVDSKMASLAQERSSVVQQLLFLSELKSQMLK